MRKSLPPLEANQVYRATDFERFEFTVRSLQQQIAHEDTAVVRLILKNSVVIEVPADDETLQKLMAVLMRAYPLKANALMKV